jgi:ribosome biogenesis GTPase / thiamine phosphate phosphatase
MRDPNALRGIVITAAGPHWVVQTNDTFVLCGVSGTVFVPHTSTMIAIGDVVWVVWIDPDSTSVSEQHTTTQPMANIIEVQERTTLLSRKAAGRARKEQVVVANVTQLCIVMAAESPMYNKRLIDRYLIAADKGDLAPMIVINKLDLLPTELHEVLMEDIAVYRNHLQIPVFAVSVLLGHGLEPLRNQLRNHATLLSGPSGVGKSSLINVLTDNRLRVGEISEKMNKGTHTTTASLWLPLNEGGAIVDSPGIREFACWELTRDELPWYFGEFVPFIDNCKFPSCTHTHEPNCGVKDAVDSQQISEERYISYLHILSTI